MAKILLVEDHGVASMGIKRYLELVGKHEVDVAAIYNQALEYIEGTEYPVALLDIFLFGEPAGVKICEEIKKRSPKTQVYAVTSYEKKYTIKYCREIGFNSRLKKPLNSDRLLKVVNAAVKRYDKLA